MRRESAEEQVVGRLNHSAKMHLLETEKLEADMIHKVFMEGARCCFLLQLKPNLLTSIDLDCVECTPGHAIPESRKRRTADTVS